MEIETRYLAAQVGEDLRRKMVFVVGPRQVGKTTLAKSLPDGREGYLNWDADRHRERILRRELPVADLWVFDEIHKYTRWRGFLKGLYDERRPGQRILVTGSGRLECFGYGGDSLQGRYHLLHLHPFSVAELGIETLSGLEGLLVLGGFSGAVPGRQRNRGAPLVAGVPHPPDGRGGGDADPHTGYRQDRGDGVAPA